MPTASCPKVRLSRGPIAPCTVCTSEVQMRALVVLTIASVGPEVGIGLSANPTLPIPFITKARIAVHLQSGSPGTCCGYAMSDARVRYAMSSTRYGDAREESRLRPQDARQGGSLLPPAIVRKRERRAASRLSAAPVPRRPFGGVGVAAAPERACVGDCHRRPAIAERGARVRVRSKATSNSAVNQQVTMTAALV